MNTVKDLTPAEQTAKILAKLPVLNTKPVVTLESVEAFFERGGVATVAKPRNAFNAQKPQTIKKAKRSWGYRSY